MCIFAGKFLKIFYAPNPGCRGFSPTESGNDLCWMSGSELRNTGLLIKLVPEMKSELIYFFENEACVYATECEIVAHDVIGFDAADFSQVI